MGVITPCGCGACGPGGVPFTGANGCEATMLFVGAARSIDGGGTTPGETAVGGWDPGMAIDPTADGAGIPFIVVRGPAAGIALGGVGTTPGWITYGPSGDGCRTDTNGVGAESMP